MEFRLGWLGRQWAVAIIYGIAYMLLRKAGFAHFVPASGLKLAVLLLMPRRYWPALLVSETLLLMFDLYDGIGAFGWAFYVASILPPIALLMMVVGLCQDRLPGLVFPDIHLGSVLVCIFGASVLLVADGLMVASLMPEAARLGRKPLTDLVSDYFLGTYSGMLAVVPLALAGAQQWHQHRSLRGVWRENQPLLQAALITLAAVGIEVLVLAGTDDAMLRFTGQAVLFVPTAYFAITWGWRGAAVIGAIASFGIVALMPAMFDIATLMTQTMMALFLTISTVLGMQTTRLKHALAAVDDQMDKARLEQHLAEMKLQRSSFELAYVSGELARAHRHLLIQLDHSPNRGEVDSYKRALTMTTSRLKELADALSPPMGASHPNALAEGPLAQVLESFGIDYQADVQGHWSRLPRNTLSLLYRLACEAASYLLKECPSDRIVLSTDTRTSDDGTLIHLRVSSEGAPVAPPSPDKVTKGLGTLGLGLSELRLRAQLFNGDVTVDGRAIQVTLRQELTVPRFG
ncbi:MASE1 domain-containing protein [Dyella sp. BiH032]|uniref:MASE1 domain-containing protein n=1 Tax=Dyella sp. BiH032 TaxID=3075430 RepID=UPI00289362EB|nr:MASE1 domain-containing protein [Dyella sp. BiH032]WNL44721.1 MASE1 domain-containing protein [Dyella sp. BiH032]